MPFSRNNFLATARLLHSAQPSRTRIGTTTVSLLYDGQEIHLQDQQHTTDGFLKWDLITKFDPNGVVYVREETDENSYGIRIGLSEEAKTTGTYGGKPYTDQSTSFEIHVPSREQQLELIRHLEAAFL